MKQRNLLLITLLFTMFTSFTKAQSGGIDLSFNPYDIGFGGDNVNTIVRTTAIQSDGKIIVGGEFVSNNETVTNLVVRLNIDGTLDDTFNLGKMENGSAYAIFIQGDGKIIIGGNFTSYNGTSRNRIARLNTDGTIDNTFNYSTGADNTVMTTTIQSDGKIIIGGQFLSYNGSPTNHIARLNADGTLDATFEPGTGADSPVLTTALQSDGKIIIGGEFTSFNEIPVNYIVRLNSDGTLDPTFIPGTGANNTLLTTSVQSDGKIIIGGNFTSYNGTSRNRIARLNADGTLDAAFHPDANHTIHTTAIQTDGKIIIGGEFTFYDGTSISRIARLNADGTLDATFKGAKANNSFVITVAIQSDGRIVFGGRFSTFNEYRTNKIARLNTDGSLDTTFNPGTGANSAVFASDIQSDGKILIGGWFTSYNGIWRNHIARLNTDGSLDASFNPGTGANNFIKALAIQSDGKIIIGGRFTSYNDTPVNYIARLNTDGSLDPEFNPGSTGANSFVETISIQSDGKIVIAGWFTSYNETSINRIARLNADGTLDTSFNPGSGVYDNAVLTTAIQSDGKIIIGGTFFYYDGRPRIKIARINADGSLDDTFNTGIGTNYFVGTISIQSDGKIIIGGQFSSYNGTPINQIARLNTDGSLDTTFDPGSAASNTVFSSVIQSDGKIIIGGQFTFSNPNAIARLNTDGSPDPTFNPGKGPSGHIWTISIQSDGKIIIGGHFASYNGTARVRVARILNSFTTGMSDINSSNIPASVYPTPVSRNGVLYINIDLPKNTSDFNVEIIDLNGSIIKKKKVTQNSASIRVPDKSGFYIVRTLLDSKVISSNRIIVND